MNGISAKIQTVRRMQSRVLAFKIGLLSFVSHVMLVDFELVTPL